MHAVVQLPIPAGTPPPHPAELRSCRSPHSPQRAGRGALSRPLLPDTGTVPSSWGTGTAGTKRMKHLVSPRNRPGAPLTPPSPSGPHCAQGLRAPRCCGVPASPCEPQPQATASPYGEEGGRRCLQGLGRWAFPQGPAPWVGGCGWEGVPHRWGWDPGATSQSQGLHGAPSPRSAPRWGSAGSAPTAASGSCRLPETWPLWTPAPRGHPGTLLPPADCQETLSSVLHCPAGAVGPQDHLEGPCSPQQLCNAAGGEGAPRSWDCRVGWTFTGCPQELPGSVMRARLLSTEHTPPRDLSGPEGSTGEV